MSAGKPPIQDQLSLSGMTPKYDAKLKAKMGRKTLNPEADARPMPRQIDKIVSKFIYYFFQMISKVGPFW